MPSFCDSLPTKSCSSACAFILLEHLGPSIGERTESYEQFPCDIPQMEALEQLAGIAAHKLERLPRRPAGSSIFFQPAPDRNRVGPNANSAVVGPDRQCANSRILHKESGKSPATPE